MTQAELSVFSEKHRNILWIDDIENEQVLFRNSALPWYQADGSRSTGIKYWKLETMNEDEVVDAVNRGLMVEGMTRVTGYFSKVNQWNKGKIAELKDRRRMDLHGNPARISMREINELQASVA